MPIPCQVLPKFKDLFGKKTLILGETGTGKTFFSFNYLKFLLNNSILPKEITVLDFGPPVIQKPTFSIGGTFAECISLMDGQDTILKPKILEVLEKFAESIDGEDESNKLTILTPRFSAQTADQVIQSCCHNYRICKKQFDAFIRHPTKYLIINDVGIFLHLGGLYDLLKTMKQAETVLLNAYWGKRLVKDYGSNISSREHQILKVLGRKYQLIEI